MGTAARLRPTKPPPATTRPAVIAIHSTRRTSFMRPPPRRSGRSAPGGGARHRPAFGHVHHLLQLLAHLEEGRALGGDVHLLPGLGVPAVARLAHLHLEAAEAPDLDALAQLQRFGHGVEDRVHHDLRVLLRDVRRALRHLLDEPALGHRLPPGVYSSPGFSPSLRPSFPARRSPSVVAWLADCCAARRLSASRSARSVSARMEREIFCSSASTRVTSAVTLWPTCTTSEGFCTRSLARSALYTSPSIPSASFTKAPTSRAS